MRALDCIHQAHDDIHFSADTDEELVEQIRKHRDEYHVEMTDDDIRQLVAANAYEE